MDYIIKALEGMDYSPTSKNSEYYNEFGTRVPRVTEIISRMIHNDSLMYWANSIGLKGQHYKDVLTNAASLGTAAHSAIERFFKENIESIDNTPFMGFLMWYNQLLSMGIQIEILAVERRLTCQWFGGTLDCLARINGKIYLIDFKTSNHVTFNYFLQLAAYRYMLKIVDGTEIDGVIVLQLNKQEPGFNEYLLDFVYQEHLEFMAHCELTFLSLVYAFYNVSKTEFMYKSIF